MNQPKLRNRIPSAAIAKQRDVEMQELFIQSADKNIYDHLKLKDRSLEELAQQYRNFDNQTQLIKGLILLEARERIPDNKKFGEWVAFNELDAGSSQARNNYMNLAKFFRNRSMEGIVLSAAYQLSRPIFADVAVDVYNKVRNKNMSLVEVTHMLQSRRNERLLELNPPQPNYQQSLVLDAVLVPEPEPEPIKETSLGAIMPIEVLKMSRDWQEAQKHKKVEEVEFVASDGKVYYDIIEAEEEPSPVADLKNLAQEEKIKQVKEFVDLLAKGKMEAWQISKAVSDYYLDTRYKP
jgi:hypothetical protein